MQHCTPLGSSCACMTTPCPAMDYVLEHVGLLALCDANGLAIPEQPYFSLRTPTVYDGVYHTPGPIVHGRYLPSLVGIVPVGVKKLCIGNISRRELSKDVRSYRSVLAPSWLSSNRPWKTAPAGCDVHRRISYICRYPLPQQPALLHVVNAVVVNFGVSRCSRTYIRYICSWNVPGMYLDCSAFFFVLILDTTAAVSF